MRGAETSVNGRFERCCCNSFRSQQYIYCLNCSPKSYHSGLQTARQPDPSEALQELYNKSPSQFKHVSENSVQISLLWEGGGRPFVDLPRSVALAVLSTLRRSTRLRIVPTVANNGCVSWNLSRSDGRGPHGSSKLGGSRNARAS
jgi:hypothetical protein